MNCGIDIPPRKNGYNCPRCHIWACNACAGEAACLSCLLVCHPPLTSITFLTAVWAQACGLENKNTFVIIVHLWSTGIHDSSLFVLVCWLEQYQGTATAGADCLDPRTCNNFRLCALVNWPQYHDTVYCGARVRDGRSTLLVLAWSEDRHNERFAQDGLMQHQSSAADSASKHSRAAECATGDGDTVSGRC